MVFVVDASVAAGWFLPDERTENSDALALRMQSEEAIAPDLFWHEARSLLLAALRRGRIPEAAVYMSLNALRRSRSETPARATQHPPSGSRSSMAYQHTTPPIWIWPCVNTRRLRWLTRDSRPQRGRKACRSSGRSRNNRRR
jgi:hypothetical protein